MIFCGKYYGKITLNSHHDPSWGNEETEFPREIKWKTIKKEEPWELCLCHSKYPTWGTLSKISGWINKTKLLYVCLAFYKLWF